MCEKNNYKYKSLAKRLFFTVYWLKDTHTQQHLQSAHIMDTRGYKDMRTKVHKEREREKKENQDEIPERRWNDVLGKTMLDKSNQKKKTPKRKEGENIWSIHAYISEMTKQSMYTIFMCFNLLQ